MRAEVAAPIKICSLTATGDCRIHVGDDEGRIGVSPTLNRVRLDAELDDSVE